MIAARAALMALPVQDRRAVLDQPERLSAAGMTWESLAGWLQGPLDAAAWQAVIPSMGYMALLRNLRNFDDAGCRRRCRGAGGGAAGRSGAGGDVPSAADAVPLRLPGGAAAALGGGTGAGAAGVAGERPVADGSDAGVGRPVRVDVRSGVCAIAADQGRRRCGVRRRPGGAGGAGGPGAVRYRQ